MKKENNQSSWFEFYHNRVGSAEYLQHFRRKYSLFLSIIKSFSVCGMIKEEGIGIGTVSKLLGGSIYGSDICDRMLELCRANNPNINVWKEDIRDFNKRYLKGTFAVATHGVLEHFQDRDIFKILNSYHNNVKFSVHYVPTILYEKPSFGDERLLPTEYWIHTFKPFYHLHENEGKDLYLIFKHK